MQQRRPAEFLVPDVPKASAVVQAMPLRGLIDRKAEYANVCEIGGRMRVSVRFEATRKVVLVLQSTGRCGSYINIEIPLLIELADKLEKIRFGSAHRRVSKAVRDNQ